MLYVKFTNRSSLVLALCAVFMIAGCRSKIKTKTNAGPSKPAADLGDEAKEVEDALEIVGDKLHFQTREMIKVKVPKDFIADVSSVSLTNNRSDDPDGDPVELVSEQFLTHFGLSHDGGFNFTEEGDDFTWTFYPSEAGWEDKFHYCGKDDAEPIQNLIKIYVEDEDEPRFSVTALTVCDFDLFGISVAAFDNNVQVSESGGFGFQGWVNVVSNPVVYADDGESLSTGIFNIINPR
jgi:hypothetical protein